MIAASKTIRTDLMEDAALQAVVAGRCYWELAPDDYEMPLVNFSIIESPRATKDSGGQYEVQLRCFAENLTASAELAELVKDALATSETYYKYQGGRSGYTDSESREGFVELNFNFKV